MGDNPPRLVWYYGTIAQISVVYGSLTTAIAVLLSAEIGAIVLLLGAQVIAEYERVGRLQPPRAAVGLHTVTPPKLSEPSKD